MSTKSSAVLGAAVPGAFPGHRATTGLTGARGGAAHLEALTAPFPPAEVIVTVAPAIRRILQATGAP
jgi:hypothetical protein